MNDSKNYWPDIRQILYREKPASIDVIIDEIIELFQSMNVPIWAQAANKLLEYKNYKGINKDIDGLKKVLKKWKKNNSFTFGIEITKRKKSLIKFLRKIFLFIQKSKESTQDEEKKKFSLDAINDIGGIRLIADLGAYDNKDALKILDNLANEVIDYFLFRAHYTLKIAEPLIGIGNENSNQLIYIPTENLIKEDYRINVKDYYRSPKSNGYQSLHIIFQSPHGYTIEVQLRTLATHMRVEYDEASCHKTHDESRYDGLPDVISKIDYTKVNILGFRWVSGHVYDAVGFLKSSNSDNFI
ncbi:MAG: hypothetical protein HUJ68_05065 [Clostridia bacterium]|nr:hypothetical protein [Clostridia bacterium]